MEKILEWKKNSLHLDINKGDPVLGRKYWVLSKKRWEHKLVSKRGQKFAMDRNNTLTYSNVHQNYQLTHPEMCLVVDKVGAN